MRQAVMKFFIATVFLFIFAAIAHAATISYKVDYTFGIYTLTGTVETDGTIDSHLTQTNAPNANWDVTLTGGGNTINIQNVFFDGTAIYATDKLLQYDFTTISSTPSPTYLLFSNSSNPAIWCLQTTTGCNAPSPNESSPYEFINIGGSVVLEGSRAGAGLVTIATVVPVPAAVWLFGSGLIGLVGIARLKR
jgi:hypothetical protein